jgi:hypothetical protein
MIYSPSHNIAFAHYPKCGGTSITNWFKNTFEDAQFLETERLHKGGSHLNVKGAIELIQRGQKQTSLWKSSDNSPTIELTELRIIGVLRDPFDMLVSLYTFWKHVPFTSFGVAVLPKVILTAREESFCRFLEVAILEKTVETYHSFFNVDGPLWNQTYVLPFENLENTLTKLSVELDLPASKTGLKRLNVNPKPDRKIHTYLYEASSLLADIEQHFSWYYSEACNHLYKV